MSGLVYVIAWIGRLILLILIYGFLVRAIRELSRGFEPIEDKKSSGRRES